MRNIFCTPYHVNLQSRIEHLLGYKITPEFRQGLFVKPVLYQRARVRDPRAIVENLDNVQNDLIWTGTLDRAQTMG